MCEFFLFCHEWQQIWYIKWQHHQRIQHIQQQQQQEKRSIATPSSSNTVAVTVTTTPTKWTKDPVLATKHFTNIYRELDTGIIYFCHHILCNLHNDVFLHQFISLRNKNYNHNASTTTRDPPKGYFWFVHILVPLLFYVVKYDISFTYLPFIIIGIVRFKWCNQLVSS